MSIGTKSILFGVHQFAIHPWFVALAWWRLYGFPWDPRLWVAFFVHDLGYLGKPNMDGPEGEQHPVLGARIMSFLFGPSWGAFTLYHSRFLAKRDNARFSPLCVADKLATALMPCWLYLLLGNLTGEIHEYMRLSRAKEGSLDSFEARKYASMRCTGETPRAWFVSVRDYLRRWVEEHKDGRQDTWTPEPERGTP